MEVQYREVGKDKVRVALYRWPVEDKIRRGVIQICHNYFEHMGRYEEFCKFLNDYGYEVIGHDHLYHGRTRQKNKNNEVISDNTMETLIEITHGVKEIIDEEYKDVKKYILGISMGGIIALRLCQLYKADYDGLLLLGVNGNDNKVLDFIIKTLSKIQGNFKNEAGNLWNMMFTYFNLSIKGKSKFRFLTSNIEELNLYENDPLILKTLPNVFLINYINTMLKFTSHKELVKIDKGLPILLLGGGNDPTNSRGSGIINFAKDLRKAKLNNIFIRLYDKAQNDIIFDTSRVDVENDIINFLHMNN